MDRIYFYLFVFFGAISAVVCQLPGHVGVCNGRVGNNLPTEGDVVQLYRANGIKRMRIYDPNQATLAALRRSDIELILDVPNNELQSLQSDATQWVRNNVAQYFPDTRIRYIAVGNEVDPEKPEVSRYVPLVLPAMRSIHRALTNLGLQNQIKVSTASYSNVLKDSYPPSRTSFKDESFMRPIVNFLRQNGSPLLMNIYPYFAYLGGDVGLEFALSTSPRVEYTDNGLAYQNLFDAMVDGVYYALEKVGGGDVGVVVSESGWPSGGGQGGGVETMANAETYLKNLIRQVGGGTPKRKGRALETYLFGMFDENAKPGNPTERHFGLFTPQKNPKYPQLGLRSA